MKKWLKKIRGVALIEAALTIPPVFYVILFSIELIHMNQIQIVLNAIAEESTMSLIISNNSWGSFYDAASKHGMEAEFNNGTLQYELIVYTSLNRIMTETPTSNTHYGGADVFVNAGDYNSGYLATYGTAIQPIRKKHITMVRETNNDAFEWAGFSSEYKGFPFMVTFTYKYQFSSAFIAMLFNGGSNTSNGSAYLLWSRGVGICEGIPETWWEDASEDEYWDEAWNEGEGS
ncbi:MAG: pilus assembly protein [Alphaproteobacteria bacterium]|nr:pilus assembly protein [Alphaproteobacteria bacterium]